MLRILFCFIGACLFCGAARAELLMVADEFPAMRVLAEQLRAQAGVASQVVAQTNMPSDLTRFEAVIVYIHGKLNESAETAFIRYTENGGKLIPLHHSISSGKRKNRYWFKFLGVALPEGDVRQGGYKWTEGVSLDIVNLAADQFITTNQVPYTTRFEWQPVAAEPARTLPGFTLSHSEVYLNHILAEPRKVLLGLRYTDTKSGQTYQQAHAGWVRAAGKGWIVYLMPGHSVAEFENPAYARLVVNAVLWKP